MGTIRVRLKRNPSRISLIWVATICLFFFILFFFIFGLSHSVYKFGNSFLPPSLECKCRLDRHFKWKESKSKKTVADQKVRRWSTWIIRSKTLGKSVVARQTEPTTSIQWRRRPQTKRRKKSRELKSNVKPEWIADYAVWHDIESDFDYEGPDENSNKSKTKKKKRKKM